MFEGLLKGKSVVITGACSGVGRASALIFADHGARLILADIQKDWVDETVDLVTKAGGEAKAVACDVTKKADVLAAVKAAVDAYGRLDVMYNNAGVASPPNETGMPAKFGENTEEQIERPWPSTSVACCSAARSRWSSSAPKVVGGWAAAG